MLKLVKMRNYTFNDFKSDAISKRHLHFKKNNNISYDQFSNYFASIDLNKNICIDDGWKYNNCDFNCYSRDKLLEDM